MKPILMTQTAAPTCDHESNVLYEPCRNYIEDGSVASRIARDTGITTPDHSTCCCVFSGRSRASWCRPPQSHHEQSGPRADKLSNSLDPVRRPQRHRKVFQKPVKTGAGRPLSQISCARWTCLRPHEACQWFQRCEHELINETFSVERINNRLARFGGVKRELQKKARTPCVRKVVRSV